MIYVAPDADVIAVAVEGVMHRFGHIGETVEEVESGQFVHVQLGRGFEDAQLPPGLEDLAQQIADDPRYDEHSDDGLLEELAAEVSDRHFQNFPTKSVTGFGRASAAPSIVELRFWSES